VATETTAAVGGWRLPAMGRMHLVVGLPCLLATLLLTLPLGAPAPFVGLDPSWRLVLNTAGDAQFGHDIVFTYGPWGFLDTPLITSRASYALALLVRACVIAALWVVSVRGLTQRWPLWFAAPVVSVFVLFVASSDMSTLAVAVTAQYVLWCALTRSRAEQPHADLIRVAGLAALAGLMLQVKFSNGLAVGLLAVLALVSTVGLSGRRRVMTAWGCAAGAFLGVLCAAWLARGQSLANLGSWARGSLELTSGYSEAMSLELIESGQRGYAVAVLLGLLAVAVVVPSLLGLGLRHRVIALLVLTVTGGFAFKSAFIRHDAFHQGLYFVVVGALFLVLVGTSRVGSWLAATGAIVATAMAASTMPPAPGPSTAADRWRADASVLTSRDHQVDLLGAARTAMQTAHQVPAPLLEQLGVRPVSIDPYEASVAWANRLDWEPVPVFQLYAAYTPALDQLNATALEQAPPRQQVLRHELTSLDGRNPLWDSPLYHLALGCNYRTVAAEASWTLLAKDRNRCGQPESLGREHVAAQRRVEVPPSSGNDIMLARFTPDPPTLLVRLGRALVKPLTPMFATADDLSFRISRKTSPSGLLVSFPAVEAGAYAPVDIRSLAFTEPGTVEFVRIPVTRRPGPGSR